MCFYLQETLKAPIATKVVCFSRLLKCLRSLYDKQCGTRSDSSYRSSLFWVHAVCFYTKFVSNVRQLFAADDFSRGHFQMHFFLGSLRVNNHKHSVSVTISQSGSTLIYIKCPIFSSPNIQRDLRFSCYAFDRYAPTSFLLFTFLIRILAQNVDFLQF